MCLINRCERVCSDTQQINTVIFHFYFLSWWKFCDFTVLEQIEQLCVSQPIVGCILLTVLSISDNYTLLLLLWRVGWILASPLTTFHICLLADAMKVEIKSECFRILSTGQRNSSSSWPGFWFPVGQCHCHWCVFHGLLTSSSIIPGAVGWVDKKVRQRVRMS